MPTVGSLSYQIVASHGELTAGITASRSELRTLRNTFLATQTPVERFSMAIDHLTKMADKFPEKAGPINRAIGQMRDEMFKAAQTPIDQKASLIQLRMSKLQLVLDPVSLAFRALHMSMDLARQGMQAIEQIAGKVAEQMRELDELAKKSRTLGIDPAALVGLRGAAQNLAGIMADDLDRGLSIFNSRLAEAAISGKGVTDTLERLGLKASELVKLGPDQAFLKVADALSKVGNPAERMRLAELLTKSREMATLLAAGGDEIQRLSERQKELSQIEWINVKGIEEANDKLAELQTVFQSIFDLLASELSPVVKDVAGDMVDGFGNATDKGEGLRDIIAAIADKLALAVDATKALGSAAAALGPTLSGIAQQLDTTGIAKSLANAAEVAKFLEFINKGNPDSAVAKLEAARFAAPLPTFAEFRKPASERGGSGIDPEDKNRGPLTVGKPPGVEAFEIITKERERVIKLEEKRAETEMKMWRERQDAARKVLLETRTDAEKINQRQAELRGLPLDDDTRRRALMGLHDELVDVKNRLAFHGPQSIGGIRAGSVEALRARFSGQSTEEKMLKTEQEQQKELKLATDLLGQIKTEISKIGFAEAP